MLRLIGLGTLLYLAWHFNIVGLVLAFLSGEPLALTSFAVAQEPTISSDALTWWTAWLAFALLLPVAALGVLRSVVRSSSNGKVAFAMAACATLSLGAAVPVAMLSQASPNALIWLLMGLGSIAYAFLVLGFAAFLES